MVSHRFCSRTIVSTVLLSLFVLNLVSSRSCTHYVKHIDEDQLSDNLLEESEYMATESRSDGDESREGSAADREREPTRHSKRKDPEEDELQVRLEYIKQQILHKLGLNKAPKVRRKDMDIAAYLNLVEVHQQKRQQHAAAQFPSEATTQKSPTSTTTTRAPTVAGTGSGQGSDEESDKLFVFPVWSTSSTVGFNLTLNSPTTSQQPIKKITMFVKQKIAKGAESEQEITVISSTSSPAKEDHESGRNMRVLGVVKAIQVLSGRDSESDPLEENVLHSSSLKWIEYDLTQLLLEDRFQPYDHLQHQQKIVINSNKFKLYSSFLTVEYDYNHGLRSKRSVDCDASGNSSSCCRETFYVNFTHIGWDNWILQPAGYFANYCKGKCDISHARYHHTTVVQKYPSMISLCCSPREMSHISLIYVDEDGFVFQKNLPNMVVESCDCA